MNTDCPYILESMAINYDDNRRIATHPLFMSNISDMKKMILYKLPSMRLID